MATTVPALAAPVVYTDRAAFLAATANPLVSDFSGLGNASGQPNPCSEANWRLSSTALLISYQFNSGKVLARAGGSSTTGTFTPGAGVAAFGFDDGVRAANAGAAVTINGIVDSAGVAPISITLTASRGIVDNVTVTAAAPPPPEYRRCAAPGAIRSTTRAFGIGSAPTPVKELNGTKVERNDSHRQARWRAPVPGRPCIGDPDVRLKIDARLSYDVPRAADVLLAIEAAPMAEQRLVEDRLTVGGVGPLHTVPGDDGIGRRTWARAHGPFVAAYHGVFDVERVPESLDGLHKTALPDLPAEVIPYLWPSRFCESDRFAPFVAREFGHLSGGASVAAMADWIYRNIDYRIGSSNGTTSAADTFLAREGVCRDFAHVMAAFVRAADIPARLVSAYAWQLDPPDFHAVVDVWLDGRWRLVDASGLAPIEGLVRIAVGRDATDISFMTIFGTADLREQSVSVARVDPPSTATSP